MLSQAATFAAAHSLSGMEFAAGIPGSIGGAVTMNAGAYGGEIKQILKSVTVLTDTGEEQNIPVESLDLSYRHSCIPSSHFIVLRAEFQLAPGAQQAIEAQMAALKEQRIAKQPLEYPSAGSTFKRPQGHYAGALIETCGLKGARVGGAQVSPKHAGFVVNTGGATCADVLALIAHIQAVVLERSGVQLEPEVKVVL